MIKSFLLISICSIGLAEAGPHNPDQVDRPINRKRQASEAARGPAIVGNSLRSWSCAWAVVQSPEVVERSGQGTKRRAYGSDRTGICHFELGDKRQKLSIDLSGLTEPRYSLPGLPIEINISPGADRTQPLKIYAEISNSGDASRLPAGRMKVLKD